MDFFSRMMSWKADNNQHTASNAVNTTIRAGRDAPISISCVDISSPLSDIPLESCTPVSLGKQSERRLCEFYNVLRMVADEPMNLQPYTHEFAPNFKFSGETTLTETIDKIVDKCMLEARIPGIKIDIPITQLWHAFKKTSNYIEKYRKEYLEHSKTFNINHNLWPSINSSDAVRTNNVTQHYKRLITEGWDKYAGNASCVVVYSSTNNIKDTTNDIRKTLKDDITGIGTLSVYKWLPRTEIARRGYSVEDNCSIPGQAMLSLWYQVHDVPRVVAYWMAAEKDPVSSSVTSTLIQSYFPCAGDASAPDVYTQCITSDPGWFSLEQKRLTGATTDGVRMSQRTRDRPFAYKSNRNWTRNIGIAGKRMNSYNAKNELVSVSTGAGLSNGTYLLASVPHMQMLLTHFNAGSQEETPVITHARLANVAPRYTIDIHGCAREVHGVGHIHDRFVCRRQNDKNQNVLTVGMWDRTAQFKTGSIVKNTADDETTTPVTYMCPNRDLILFD